MPAVVKTDNTIGFNVISPVITPVLAIKPLGYSQYNLFSCSSCESVDKSKLFYGTNSRDL